MKSSRIRNTGIAWQMWSLLTGQKKVGSLPGIAIALSYGRSPSIKRDGTGSKNSGLGDSWAIIVLQRPVWQIYIILGHLATLLGWLVVYHILEGWYLIWQPPHVTRRRPNHLSSSSSFISANHRPRMDSAPTNRNEADQETISSHVLPRHFWSGMLTRHIFTKLCALCSGTIRRDGGITIPYRPEASVLLFVCGTVLHWLSAILADLVILFDL
jgi:hypothetical protein